MFRNKKINFLVVLWLFFIASKAQVNLVVNPSFETYTACPTNQGGDIDKATGWDTCRATADYFNTCGTTTYFQIPKNLLGFQYPAYGNAYSGLITYDAGSFYREIIIGQLSSSLTVSQKYFISFKISRADSNLIVGYSTNKLGIKFSKIKQNWVSINNTAHYYSNTVITDTISWTKISGSFIADSTYSYLMIGNFFDDVNTTVLNHGTGSISYYYIDEVCVSTDSTYAANYITGINKYENNKSKPLLYPNPANDFFVVGEATKNDIKVFNGYGNLIDVKTDIKGNGCVIHSIDWLPGVYFIETKNKHYKIIINH
ncbi:MAG: T9SS type A sorting domain-containing protein [Bacteroidota bacterium]|nr:T9SS type A sorting domain-containing protein [Bacteroidota bacterium]